MRILGVEIGGRTDGDAVLHERLTVVALDEGSRSFVASAMVEAGQVVTAGVDLEAPDPGIRAAAAEVLDRAVTAAASALEEATEAERRASAALGARETALAEALALEEGSVAETAELVLELDAADADICDRRAQQVEAACEVERLSGRCDALRSLQERIEAEQARPSTASARRRGDTVEDLRGLLTEMEHLDVASTAVRERFSGWITSIEDGTVAVAPAASRLVQERERLVAAWDLHGSGLVGDDPSVQEASRHLRDANELVEELERQLAKGGLGESARDAIESAHARRVALEEKGGSARGNGEERDRLLAEETAVLERFGFGSYLDYSIVMSTLGAGQLAKNGLEVASQAVSEAEVALHDAEAAVEARHEELRAATAAWYDRAAALLGLVGEADGDGHRDHERDGAPGWCGLDDSGPIVELLVELVAEDPALEEVATAALVEVESCEKDLADEVTVAERASSDLDLLGARRGDVEGALERARQVEATRRDEREALEEDVDRRREEAAERSTEVADLQADHERSVAEREALDAVAVLDDELDSWCSVLADLLAEGEQGEVAVLDEPLALLPSPAVEGVLDRVVLGDAAIRQVVLLTSDRVVATWASCRLGQSGSFLDLRGRRARIGRRRQPRFWPSRSQPGMAHHGSR